MTSKNRKRSIYDQRKQHNLCVKCSAQVKPGNAYCDPCKSVRRQCKKRHDAVALQQNNCVDCGLPKRQDKRRCDVCLSKNRISGKLLGKLILAYGAKCYCCYSVSNIMLEHSTPATKNFMKTPGALNKLNELLEQSKKIQDIRVCCKNCAQPWEDYPNCRKHYD